MSSSVISFLSMVEAELPPGFRFHPRDDELVCDYLAPKLGCGEPGFPARRCRRPPMVDVDLNRVEPWDLPAAASVGPREWYFFSLKDRKYATGQRTNRATASGYWKATGKDRAVARRGALVGMRKTLVFYQGRAPKGRKTEWVMHEYRTMEGRRRRRQQQQQQQSTSPTKLLPQQEEDWVLCRVICKKKPAGAGGGGGATSKPARGPTTNGRDTATASPPLPPLTDTTTLLAAQLQAAMSSTGGAVEQVPCFSSFNSLASDDSGGGAANAAQPPCYLLPTVTAGSSGMGYLDQYGLHLPEPAGGCYEPLNSDKKLLRAVLSQLAGGEVVPCSLSPDDVAAANSTWMNHF